jgi:hypothetical protein
METCRRIPSLYKRFWSANENYRFLFLGSGYSAQIQHPLIPMQDHRQQMEKQHHSFFRIQDYTTNGNTAFLLSQSTIIDRSWKNRIPSFQH